MNATFLMERVSDSWTFRGWHRELRALLGAALASPAAAPAARESINRLAAHGHMEFRDLLSEGAEN